MDVCCAVMICLLVKVVDVVLAKAAGSGRPAGSVDEKKRGQMVESSSLRRVKADVFVFVFLNAINIFHRTNRICLCCPRKRMEG